MPGPANAIPQEKPREEVFKLSRKFLHSAQWQSSPLDSGIRFRTADTADTSQWEFRNLEAVLRLNFALRFMSLPATLS